MFGTEMVFKAIRGKTFVSPPARRPDRRKESEAQRNTRKTFAKATAWAQLILLNPEKKAYYQQRAKELKLPNAYTAAITDYMRKPKVEVGQQEKDTFMYTVSKPGFTVKAVTATTEGGHPPEVKRQKNDKWFLYYTPKGDESSFIELTITDNLGKITTWRPTRSPRQTLHRML